MTSKVYEIVTDKILEALDRGTVPWRKPWTAGIPRNATTSRPYHGINTVLLGMAPYADQRWLTFRQAAQLGGNVCKGARSSLVVFWKQHLVTDERDGEELTRTIPLLRYFNLFNVAQCEGLNLPAVPASYIEPIEAATAIVDGMPNRPSITDDGGDRAFYVPSTDAVHMPEIASFIGAGEYHTTLFHELTHSTGHKSRLNRESLDTPAPFGSPIYSKEELVAEFGAAFLSAQAGIDNTMENSAAYIAGWSRALRADKRLVIAAASQGQKAADYVLGGA